MLTHALELIIHRLFHEEMSLDNTSGSETSKFIWSSYFRCLQYEQLELLWQTSRD